MKNKVARLLLCLVGITVLLSGCYRGEIDQLQKQVGEINVKSLEEQVASMKESVADLKALKEQLEPAIDELTKEKQKIEAELEAVKSQVGDISSASAAVQSKVSELTTRLETLDAAVKVLESVNVDERIKEINETSKKLKDGLTELEALSTTFATADELARISATVDAIAEAFDSNFNKALDRCRDKIISWVSDDPNIMALFNDYYTKSEVDALLKLIETKNGEQDETMKSLYESIHTISDELKNFIYNTVNGEFKTLDEKFENQFKSLSERVDGIELIVKGILDNIGDMTTLAIKGNLVNAINVIYNKFGTFDGTVESILTALQSDITLLQAADSAIRGGAADSVSLQSLNKRTATLATIASVEELRTSVSGIQKTLDSLLTKKAFEEAIAAYLTKEDAANTYATAKALGDFFATYIEVVGDKDNPAAGTILARIAILGSGSFTENWVTNLTDAVNTLHGLVGSSSVSEQAQTISQGIVDDFVKTILGGGDQATADSLKNLLKGFTASIKSLGTDIGDISKIGDADISTAIAGIKANLDTLATTYAAIDHVHTCDDITDLITVLSSKIGDITGSLNDLRTEAKDNLVAAINELVNSKTTLYQVDSLAAVMENILAGAVYNGGDNVFKTYFATLNLKYLDSLVNNITKADGNIDLAIRNAIDTMNVEKYLTRTELEAKGYLTTSDVDPAVVTALANLSVVIGGKTFDYSHLDAAIDTVYKILAGHLDDYSAAKGSYDSVKERFEAIEGLIGSGFSSTRSITSVIDSINLVFGQLGTGKSVKALTDSLFGLYSSLVNALVGKEGTVNDITDENNLNALKARLDALGFEDVSDGTQTLAEALQEIRDSIDALRATIGGDYNKNKTVASDIAALQTALGSFTNTEYQATVSGLRASLDSLINACAGTETGGTITDVANLVKTIHKIDSTFKEIQVNGQKGIENILKDCDLRLDTLFNIIGDPSQTLTVDIDGKPTTFSIDKSLVEEILNIKALLGNEDYWKEKVGRFSDVIEQMTGVDAISKKIGELESLNRDLWTVPDNYLTKQPVLIPAINKLYSIISEVQSDLMNDNYATEEDIANLKAILLGTTQADTLDYKDIKSLSAALVEFIGVIGTKPVTEKYSTLYGAISYLESTISTTIGTKPQSLIDAGYPDTIWAALEKLQEEINKLKEASEKAQSLMDKILSCVYIPDYSDGSIVLPCNEARTIIGNLAISFYLSATADFIKEFGTSGGDKYSVGGMVKKVKIRSKAVDAGTYIDGSANLDSDGNLTVSFSTESLKNVLPTPAEKDTYSSQIAIVIKDKTSGEEFTTQYIPLKPKDYPTSLVVDPTTTSSSHHKYAYNTKKWDSESNTITITDLLGCGYKVTASDWIYADTSTPGKVVVTVKDGNPHSGGNVTITSDGDTNEKYIYDVEEKEFKIALKSSDFESQKITEGEEGEPLTGYYASNHTYTIGITSEEFTTIPACGVSCSSTWIKDATVSNGTLTFRTEENTTGSDRTSATITITPENGVPYTFTFKQPKKAVTLDGVTFAVREDYNYIDYDSVKSTGTRKSGSHKILNNFESTATPSVSYTQIKNSSNYVFRSETSSKTYLPKYDDKGNVTYTVERGIYSRTSEEITVTVDGVSLKFKVTIGPKSW